MEKMKIRCPKLWMKQTPGQGKNGASKSASCWCRRIRDNKTKNQNHKILERQQETKEKTCFEMGSYKSPKVGKISSLMVDQPKENKNP